MTNYSSKKISNQEHDSKEFILDSGDTSHMVNPAKVRQTSRMQTHDSP